MKILRLLKNSRDVTIEFAVNGLEYGSAPNVIPHVTASQRAIADDHVRAIADVHV
jgi:hypothetical protein